MKHEKEFFLKIVSAVAVIAVIAMFYSILTVQNAGAKLDAQGIILNSIGSGAGGQQQNQPPVETAEISLILIGDSSNQDLIDLQSLAGQLKSLQGIQLVSEKSLEKDSAEAKQLIEKYRIEKIPALLLQGETRKVAALTQNWSRLGSIESDDTMVLRSVPPLYLELSSGRVRGITGAVYLAVPDKNEVFDIDIFKQILANAFGIKPAVERTVDYNSSAGKELVEKYKLEKLPAFFVSGDLNAYSNFEQVWQQAGSIESDGNYVFRSLEVLSGLKYLDLNKNEVVEAAGQTAQQ